MVEIDFKFPDWQGKLAAAEAELNLFSAATIQTNRGLLFDSEGSHNGRKGWAPLRMRNGQILSDRGTLRKSMAPSNPNGTPGPSGVVRFESKYIVIGTTLLYARLMNDGTTKMPGGKLVPVHAKALKIPLPQGRNATDYTKSLRKKSKKLSYEVADGVQRQGNFIFRKWVKIPARPFNDWNDIDQEELDDALTVKIAEVLNRD